MSQEATPRKIALPCGGIVSTAFTFQSVAVQSAANATFVLKSTIDGQYATSSPTAPRKYQFKSDAERMQYIIGRSALSPGCATLY
jgi:hypothetical protein